MRSASSNQRHLKPLFRRNRRRFQPDIAAADDKDPAAGPHLGLQRVDIGQRPHGIEAAKVAADGGRQAARDRAGGQGKLVVVQHLIARVTVRAEVSRAVTGLPGAQGDPAFLVKAVGAQEQAFARHLAQQVILGEGRALIGRGDLFSDQGELAVEPLLSQLCGKGGPGLSGPHDDDMRHVKPLFSAGSATGQRYVAPGSTG